MDEMEYFLLDVFSGTPFEGNPLAVFPDAADLDDARMQAIARELNLSETVFVSGGDPESARYTVRIMTPAAELPFAGHPTIGTGVLLAHRARVRGESAHGTVTLVEKVGDVPVRVAELGERGGQATFQAPRLPEAVPGTFADGQLAELLGLPASAVAEASYRPGVFSGGVPFLMIPVRDEADLARARLDRAVWSAQLKDNPVAGHVYVFCPGGDTDFSVRMFAPLMGIDEDPATGAAAVAFARLLTAQRRLADGETRLRLAQGQYMGRPSELDLTLHCRAGALDRVELGGAAIIVGKGVFYI